MPKENPAKGPATENFKRSSRFGTIFRILVIEPKDPICQKKLVRFFKHEYAQMTAKEYENKRYGQESEVGYYSCQWEIEENNALTENTHISMQPEAAQDYLPKHISLRLQNYRIIFANMIYQGNQGI